MKAFLLYWDSENTIKIMKNKIINGVIKIKKKSFAVDKVKPYLYEKKELFNTKVYPLYVIRHNDAIPYRFDFHDQKLKNAVTPENYSQLMEQGALRELLNVKGSDFKDFFMWIVIGGVPGLLLGYILASIV